MKYSLLSKIAAALSMCPLMILMLLAAPSAKAASFLVVNSPRPNWRAYGSPQPVKITAWTALVAGAPGAYENYETLSLLPFSTFTFAGDSFLGESLGVIGADIRAPTAYWLAPAVYTWAGGPAGGGGLAFFNSRVGGVYYANMLIVLDPPSTPAFTDLELGFADLGGVGLFPSSPNTSDSPNSDGTLSIPVPGFAETPEPSYLVLTLPILLGFMYWGYRRRGSSMEDSGSGISCA